MLRYEISASIYKKQMKVYESVSRQVILPAGAVSEFEQTSGISLHNKGHTGKIVRQTGQ